MLDGLGVSGTAVEIRCFDQQILTLDNETYLRYMFKIRLASPVHWLKRLPIFSLKNYLDVRRGVDLFSLQFVPVWIRALA